MALTKISYSMIQGAAYNVLDFGADPTGVASSLSAFSAAIANGGTIYIPSGTYKLDGLITLSQDNTTLWLAADVTLNCSGYTYNGTQNPFGNQIDITANNCAVIGSGPSSLIQLTNGTQANAIGVRHKSKLLVRDVVLDGGKNTAVSIADDTFESGISLISDTAGGATEDLEATIDGVTIRNFVHYGVNIYGNRANGIKIVNCNIRDNGKASDVGSVGAGIVSTNSVVDLTIANNVIKGNKQRGMFISSAGNTGNNFNIIGNTVHQNGLTGGHSGICFVEQPDYNSRAGYGLYNINVVGNICTGNGRSGIEFAALNSGFLAYFNITGNTCEGNTQNGIELSSNNTTPNVVYSGVVSGNTLLLNGAGDLAVSQYAEHIDGVLRSFTPVVVGSTSAGTATYSSQYGSYIKTGNRVDFQLVLDWSGHTGTGDMRIAGFPYAASSTVNASGANWAWANGLTITGQASFAVTGGQTYGTMAAVNNGTVSTVAIDAAAALQITGSYFVDAAP